MISRKNGMLQNIAFNNNNKKIISSCLSDNALPFGGGVSKLRSGGEMSV